MRPEPKFISISKVDCGNQSTRKQSNLSDIPASTSVGTPSITSSALLLEDIIDRKAGLQTKQAPLRKAIVRQQECHNTTGGSNVVESEVNSQNPKLEQTKDPVNLAIPGKARDPENHSPARRPETPKHLSSPPSLTHALKHQRADDGHERKRAVSPSDRPPKRRPRQLFDPEILSEERKISPALGSPPSPLFFSHTPKRPTFPPRFSSSEAAFTMMNKARDEAGGITTLKLARGGIDNTSSARGDTPRSRGSLERNSVQKSPDAKSNSSSGIQIVSSVGIVELLEQDDRPTFIIDVANPLNFSPGAPLQIIFSNAALKANESLLEMVTGSTAMSSPGVVVTNDFPEFKAWALSFVRNHECLDISLPSFPYGGIVWNCNTLRKRLRLISGSSTIITTAASPSSYERAGVSSSTSNSRARKTAVKNLSRSPLNQSSEPLDYFGGSVQVPESARGQPSPLVSPVDIVDNMPSPPKQAILTSRSSLVVSKMVTPLYAEDSFFDWTRIPITATMPKHIRFARSVDWASTPLGPIENWGFDLRAMCNLVMGSPHPAAMYWGDNMVVIYNEAYILLAGQKHPELMGQSYRDAWAEIWPDIEPAFTSALKSGQATMKDDDCLFIRRNGYLEECYFSWSLVPLIGEDGTVVGVYNPAFEKTRRKIAERRMLTLREVGERTAAAREVKEFWGQVIKGLEYNDHDVPFVFLYAMAEDPDSDLSSINSGSLQQFPQYVLEGTLGVGPDHRAAVSPLDLKFSDAGFAPYLRESAKTGKTVYLTTEDDSLSSDLIEGLEWRGFGDQCRAAIVVPIHPTTGDFIIGFLVMGINPRRPYDDDYSLFIQLLSRQLATSMASVVLFEEEIKRGLRAARLAALDRLELSKQLDLRTQEAVESDTKFTRMAEFAPVGMFIADSTGTITYSNDTWWEISRHPRMQDSMHYWMDSVKDDDREGVMSVWEALVKTKTPITHEFRFKAPWQDRNGNRGDTWVLMSAYPERDAGGNLKSVFGSITNISQQKWAEDFQKRRMEEAVELKRQQENFIDMTSHEMRNPLSAILQCSDEIATSLLDYQSGSAQDGITEKLNDVLESSIDAAQTIALCAQHQKRIVDDVLTLSKLDSALLIVTPVAVQPVAVVQRALKMFEGELDTNDIAMEFRMEKSYLDLGIDWVKLDPSRLLQVLINLTTNAIKFTNGQEKRTIVVSLGASRQRPSGSQSDVSYFPSRSKRKDSSITDEPDWGTGELLYLHFAVQDTGRGLVESEKTLLFQRFSQASPRTHVQYGGSGLGLFISRELTELQGGEIGVSSERGVGSTFAFYVKARRVDDISADTPIANAINSLKRDSAASSVTLESRKNSAGKAVYRTSATLGTAQQPSRILPAPETLPLASVTFDPRKLNVLIVEDNLVNQRVLEKQLKNLGFKTEVANHGREALEILKKSRFWAGKESDGVELAVILMDLEMPIMDGLTCTRSIRKLEATGKLVKHIPIIAVTANARAQQIEAAMSAGMDDVVSKPFRIPDLIPKIKELIAKSGLIPPLSHSNIAITSKYDAQKE